MWAVQAEFCRIELKCLYSEELVSAIIKQDTVHLCL